MSQGTWKIFDKQTVQDERKVVDMIDIYHFEDGTSQAWCEHDGKHCWMTRGLQLRAIVEWRVRRHRRKTDHQIKSVQFRPRLGVEVKVITREEQLAALKACDG